MAESMVGLKRTHRCTEVSSADIGSTVTVMGWVAKRRNLGSLIFVDLRDRSGLLQILFDENIIGKEGFDKAYTLRNEFVIAVVGKVIKRSGAVNDNLHEKELKETELKEAGQRIARKQDLLIFILSISVVLLILLYVLFLYYRHLRSLKNQLQREKELLLESQRQLIKEKTRAEEASLMKSAFLANMSHEVRTPLNAIVGFSGLLVEPSTDEEERKEYSSIIRNNTDLMLNLVNDVLDLSRMETGDLHFDIKDHLLLVCCQMALESVRHRIPDGVKLTFSPAGEPIVVHVDNLRLQQLLTNLLTNAAKFTEKGEINLSFQLEPDRKKVRIAVTDTGAGIPLEKQATIFNRFEKLDDYKPGVGLGLSICLLIAERLDGALFIDSSYTDGARFVLILSCEIDSSIYNPPIEV